MTEVHRNAMDYKIYYFFIVVSVVSDNLSDSFRWQSERLLVLRSELKLTGMDFQNWMNLTEIIENQIEFQWFASFSKKVLFPRCLWSHRVMTLWVRSHPVRFARPAGQMLLINDQTNGSTFRSQRRERHLKFLAIFKTIVRISYWLIAPYLDLVNPGTTRLAVAVWLISRSDSV